MSGGYAYSIFANVVWKSVFLRLLPPTFVGIAMASAEDTALGSCILLVQT